MTSPSHDVVIITGGSRGIGLACAREIVRAGPDVVIAARGTAELSASAAQLRATALGRVLDITVDVSDPVSVSSLFDRASTLGPLTGVIHAAAVYGPIGPITATNPQEWLAALEVDLFGTYLVTREACRRMVGNSTRGSIVLFAGGGAGGPFPNYTAYASAKVAAVRLAETVALEMAAHGVRVNALSPGFVATRLHDRTLSAGSGLAGAFFDETRRRLASAVEPEVAARAAAFLLSDAASAISGRYLAAPYDDWMHWPEHIDEFADRELFTLRRITPRDRGKSWQ